MEFQNTILLVAACVGFLNLSKFLLRMTASIWTLFLKPVKDPKEYGSWALITGSTDGIGKALALEMASKGLNLVLVGRNPSKLDSTLLEIKQKHRGVSIKTVAIDFNRSRGEEIAVIVERETSGLDIGIVVNNAGAVYPYPEFFHEVEEEVMKSVVRVNLVGPTWVTKGVISRMMETKKGLILNIGSASSACLPSFPLYTVYAATKAYVAILSKSMRLEYKHHGIDVHCQTPMAVATKMIPAALLLEWPISKVLMASPKKYGKSSVKWMGESNASLPYWPHALQAYIISFIPHTLFDSCALYIFRCVRACEHNEQCS